MKKLFTLIAAVLVTGSMMAKQTAVTPGEATLSAAVGLATAGDTLVLTTGVYAEKAEIPVTVKLTFIAAKDAKPVLKLSSGGKNFNFKAPFEMNGLEILSVTNGYVVRAGNASASAMVFKNCYLHGGGGPLIYGSNYAIGKVEIDNCVFDSCTRSEGAVFQSTGGPIGEFSFTNSTVSNMSGSYAIMVKEVGKALVDHCTFYNAGKDPIYIGATSVTNTCIVKDCIIDSISTGTATTTYAGSVSNCMYNRAAAPFDNSGVVTVSNCLAADPLFVNAAAGDFTLSASSPALTAGTDGKAIGDPRWAPQGPSTLAEALAGKTIRRALNDQEHVYVLAVDADKNPTLVKADFDGNIVINYATDSCSVTTDGVMKLSDIALTEDGVLVGCNQEKCMFGDGSGNTNPILFYKWTDEGAISIAFRYSDAFRASVCWVNGYTGGTMAFKGTLADGQILISGQSASGSAAGKYKQLMLQITDNAVAKGTVNEGQKLLIPGLQNINYPKSAQFITLGSEKVPQLFEYDNSGAGATKTETLKGALAATYSGTQGASVAKKDAADWMIIPAEDGVEILNITAGLAAAAQVHDLAAASTVEADFIYAGLTSNGEKVVLMRGASLELIDVPASGTNLDEVMMDAAKTVKVVRGGQLIIIRNGEAFNAIGTRL